MKKIFLYGIKRMAKAALATCLLLPTALSCDLVFEDQGDCDPDYFVKFVFDRNMLYNPETGIGADAFAAQVRSVDLRVYDAKTGAFVARFTEEGEPLTREGYRMSVDLAPGEYEFIAWCGLANNEGDFTVPENTPSAEGLTCTMARNHDETVAWSDKNLKAVFHGRMTGNLPDEEGEHVVTIYLTKDTNNINLSLHHHSEALDPERFAVVMSDANGYMASDNELLPDEVIEYRPWITRSGTADLSRAGEEVTAARGFLAVELSTARLMKDREMRIKIVDLETGKTIFSIPMIQWALMFRSANYASMPEQEYLDREDQYNLSVFLVNESGGSADWTAVEIVINGWHIVNNGNVTM